MKTHNTTNNLHLLVIDDSDIVRKSLHMQLKPYAAHICLAKSGDQALTTVSQSDHIYDLAFIDIQMAGTNGLETALQLKARGKVKHIVMMTSALLPQFRTLLQQIAPLTTLIKPIHTDSLTTILDTFSKNKTLTLPLNQTHSAAILDATEGLGRFGQQTHVYHSQLSCYRQQLPQLLNDISVHLMTLRVQKQASHDFELRRLVHDLKGNAGFLGLNQLSQAAKELDEAIKQDATDRAQVYQHLMRIAQCSLQTLTAYLQQHAPTLVEVA